jgi:hypothetical protein
MAISSPLLEDVTIEGATGILINITGGPDLTLHEVNEASSLIQQAAHEDANIIFGSVIDPNLAEEVRITVIATGVDRSAKTQVIVPDTRPATSTPTVNTTKRLSGNQISIPYDVSSQITKEYPPVPSPRVAIKAPAQVVEEPDIDVTWEHPEDTQTGMEPAEALASGSGPAPASGTPLVQPDRKRAQSRPSMKTVLSGEIDTDSELDVPTFIRRHSASQS